MFGDSLLSQDALVADYSTPPPFDVGAAAFLPDVAVILETVIIPRDTWGAITIPVQVAAPGTPVGNPCLGFIMSFLQTYLVTDKALTDVWKQVFPSKPPVNRIFPHDPSEVVFNVEHLPALYMWRDSATEEWAADDWLRENTIVKGLWVYPQTSQENGRIKHPFANALAKAINAGIELGRTPSWVVPGDPDPAASTIGSLFYTYAAFESFGLTSWKRSKLIIEAADMVAKKDAYPAIEFTFSMAENFVDGLDNFALMNPTSGGFITLATDLGIITDFGNMAVAPSPLAVLPATSIAVTLIADVRVLPPSGPASRMDTSAVIPAFGPSG